MDKSRTILGLCILAGLVFLGAMIPKAVNDFRSYERTVNVKGLCEKEVMADKVIWPLVLKVSSNDVDAIYRELNTKNNTVIDFLKAGGIPESAISIDAATVSDQFTEEYQTNRAFRFVAKNVITVCTSDVETVKSLIARQTELLSKGITFENSWENRIEYSYESLNDIKPEMVEEATRNAREVAQKFASDSQSKLGKIKNATQGTFSISDRDSNTPWVKNVRVVTNVTYYLKK